MGDEKIIVIDRESLRKENKMVLAAMGLALMDIKISTEGYKVLMDLFKALLDGMEMQLFGPENNSEKAAETATKEDK